MAHGNAMIYVSFFPFRNVDGGPKRLGNPNPSLTPKSTRAPARNIASAHCTALARATTRVHGGVRRLSKSIQLVFSLTMKVELLVVMTLLDTALATGLEMMTVLGRAQVNAQATTTAHLVPAAGSGVNDAERTKT